MKKPFRAQSTLEFIMITILVLAGIVVMGPYVIRSVNAYMRSWEISADQAQHDVALETGGGYFTPLSCNASICTGNYNTCTDTALKRYCCLWVYDECQGGNYGDCALKTEAKWRGAGCSPSNTTPCCNSSCAHGLEGGGEYCGDDYPCGNCSVGPDPGCATCHPDTINGSGVCNKECDWNTSGGGEPCSCKDCESACKCNDPSDPTCHWEERMNNYVSPPVPWNSSEYCPEDCEPDRCDAINCNTLNNSSACFDAGANAQGIACCQWKVKYECREENGSITCLPALQQQPQDRRCVEQGGTCKKTADYGELKRYVCCNGCDTGCNMYQCQYQN